MQIQSIFDQKYEMIVFKVEKCLPDFYFLDIMLKHELRCH